MPGQPLVLGPFPGGINNRTDPGSIEQIELNECVNFIYGVDGTLIGRWPFVEGPMSGLGSITEPLNMLGSTVVYDAGFNPHAVVIGSNQADGTWIYEAGLWDKVSDHEYKTFAAYGEQQNIIFFATNPDNPVEYGGIWEHGDASVDEKPNTPPGFAYAIYKDRIWSVGDPDFPSRINYSKIDPDGSATEWDFGADLGGFVDVDPGNGQAITNIKAYSDALVVFKDDSTYMFSFDGGISGQLVQVNGTIGTENYQSVSEYRNVLVVYHEGKMYAYGNGSYSALNDKFRFLSDSAYVSTYTHPISLSTVGDFVVLRHYDKIFMYSFITGGWCEWETDFPVGNFVRLPQFIGDEVATFFVSSILPADSNVYQMNQEWNAVDTEDFVCTVRTKVFNFDTPFAYKRLFWWGIEALTNLAVTGSAQPVSSTYTPTWEEVAEYTWDDLLLGTWGSLLSTIPDVVTGPISAQQGVVYRRMYKFLKGLRFREISFQVDLVSDGTSTNGPPRLLSVVPVLKSAEIVVQQVS